MWRYLQSPRPDPCHWKWRSCVSIPVQHRQAERSSLTNGGGLETLFCKELLGCEMKGKINSGNRFDLMISSLEWTGCFWHILLQASHPQSLLSLAHIQAIPFAAHLQCQRPFSWPGWLAFHLQQDLVVHRARQDMTLNEFIVPWLSRLCVTMGETLLSVCFQRRTASVFMFLFSPHLPSSFPCKHHMP